MSRGEFDQAEGRRLAAIMFTDIVGYTGLAQMDEAAALERLREHRELIRPILQKHAGTEVKTIGDSFLVEFPSALEAVRCSVEIQRAMHDRNASLPDSERLLIRVGVHLGDVVHDRGDILGDAVNVSSRIEPLSLPGGVCISEQVFDHVRNKLDLPLEKLEGKTLKNVKLPIDVYRIVMPWEVQVKNGSEELDTKRIAVLPLRNMSPDPNDEYFADGMTEELITALSSVNEVTVIARTSVMQYKGSPKRISEIGRELNAGTLIEGSVRKAANKVRITVQLIDGRNEGHIWAHNYDKELNDVFAIQSEVAQKVADALKVELADSKRKKIGRGSTSNSEAYTLYLKGIYYWNKRTAEGLKKAIELYEQAINLDPKFALGYAGLAMAYSVRGSNYVGDPAENYPKAREYALKALSLDDDLAEAHTALASVAVGYERNMDKAEEEFKRAIELNPNFPTAHQWYAQFFGIQNKYERALEEVNRALELNPLSLVINTNLVDGHNYREEYDDAIEQAKKVMDMDPSFPLVYPALIQSYIGKSMFTEALNAAEPFSKMGDPHDAKIVLADIYAKMGKREESMRLLEELEAVGEKEAVNPYSMALVYFTLRENDMGFRWLQKAYDHFSWSVYAMGIDKELDGVRQDPRYLALMEKTGLAGRIRPR